MDTDNLAASLQLTTEQRNKETPPELSPVPHSEGTSKYDEDFFSGLSPEEKECLENLLQTIDSLDEDLLDDDEEEEEEEEESHQELAEPLGAEDQCKDSVDSRMLQSTSVEAALAKPSSPRPALSKIKMTKSLLEESADITLRRNRPNPSSPKARGPHRLAESHPAYFRKFDTIMRSGVNVQELRSRFLHHLDSSTAVRGPTEDAAGTDKQPLPFPGGQRSPRDEALQKLGLFQRISSVPNMKSPLGPTVGQHAQDSQAESLNHMGMAGSTNTMGKPVKYCTHPNL
uniref:uncharacterized protein LOC114591924 isoform X1 n=1 Tax=Podarcis muralis TaxID=64176 RepID=UPI00109F3DD5|nr:uncharacterized protein LOC114591924 isoform X1 [Podarcis muralis]XP_028575506.1 uncharacterized protein LOC114591924 isoform X1 [Podarcis muralis]